MESMYKWYCAPSMDGTCEVIRCTLGGSTQFVTKDFLLEAEPSPFHDENLVQATRQINQIFARLEKKGNIEGERELTVLQTPQGHFLAWTVPEHDVDGTERARQNQPEGAPPLVDSNSSVADINTALRLKSVEG